MGKSWDIMHGDVRRVCKTQLEAESFDACLCDPPYGLSFMGRAWDYQVPNAMLWAEVLRVLRPGAHAMIFGGSRTFHRVACAVEDGGFELRDCLMWMYGSGFPKSLDVSKAIDKAVGAARKVVGQKHVTNAAQGKGLGHGNLIGGKVRAGFIDITAPATDAARVWQGYGTALKPAHEPIVLARKSLDGTVAENVQRWGCGALAIDACRIEKQPGDTSGWSSSGSKASENIAMSGANYARDPKPDAVGRWPANVILDAEAAAALDAQTGDRPSTLFGRADPLTSHTHPASPDRTRGSMFGNKRAGGGVYADSGGASRFFYTAKADAFQREAGCDELAPAVAKGTDTLRDGGRGKATRANTHPTVKPIDLIRYLATLILPPPNPNRPRRILVPFSGSGSEMIGCLQAGWDEVVGIEREAEYITIARARITRGGVLSRLDRKKKAVPTRRRKP